MEQELCVHHNAQFCTDLRCWLIVPVCLPPVHCCKWTLNISGLECYFILLCTWHVEQWFCLLYVLFLTIFLAFCLLKDLWNINLLKGHSACWLTCIGSSLNVSVKMIFLCLFEAAVHCTLFVPYDRLFNRPTWNHTVEGQNIVVEAEKVTSIMFKIVTDRLVSSDNIVSVLSPASWY